MSVSFFVVMHLMYSRIENWIYWDAVAFSSIRGEILIATNFGVFQAKFQLEKS